MDRSSRRQIWKLERLVAKTEKLRTAVLTKLEKSRIPYEDTVKRRRPLVRQHATAVAAIAQYGEPKIDEPLVRAWERVLAYYRTKIDGSLPSLDEIPAVEGDYDDDALEAVGKIYRHLIGDPGCGSCWDSGLVHEPESARFTEIFRTAPVWLLEFTKISWDAAVLEFDLPDMSAELVWGAEGVKDAERWPRLPLGTMGAGDPVPKPHERLSRGRERNSGSTRK